MFRVSYDYKHFDNFPLNSYSYSDYILHTTDYYAHCDMNERQNGITNYNASAFNHSLEKMLITVDCEL